MKTEMITSPKYNIGGHQRENTCVSSINNLNSALNKQRELSSDHSKLVNERFKEDGASGNQVACQEEKVRDRFLSPTASIQQIVDPSNKTDVAKKLAYDKSVIKGHITLNDPFKKVANFEKQSERASKNENMNPDEGSYNSSSNNFMSNANSINSNRTELERRKQKIDEEINKRIVEEKEKRQK